MLDAFTPSGAIWIDYCSATDAAGEMLKAAEAASKNS